MQIPKQNSEVVQMRMRGLCKLPNGRDWQWGKLNLALVDRAVLRKTVIQLSSDGPSPGVNRLCGLLCGHCSFLPGPGMHKVLFVPSKSGACFPQACGSSAIKSSGLPSQIPWRFPVHLLSPQAGKPDVEPRTLQQCENFFVLWF